MNRYYSPPECTENRVKISVCVDHPYHCNVCGEPTGPGGHFVGGSRPDARVICDPTDRRAYRALIKDAATPGRRFNPEAGV